MQPIDASGARTLPRSFATCLALALSALACSPAEVQETNRAPAPSVTPWFADATDELGLDFVHETGATGELLFPEMAGSGVAVFDADGDGRLDLLLVSGAPRDGEGPEPVHRLYLNTGGRFVDATAAAGLGGARHGMGVAVGDFDNDGNEDVFLTSLGPDRLLRGHGDGTFEDVTAAAGIELSAWSTSAVFCDVNRDGWLDLYVAQYVIYDRAVRCTDNAGRPDYCGPDSYEDEVDALLLNNGRGADGNVTFTDVTRQAGIDRATGAGLGVICDDLDGDGWPDVYVANDGDDNQLWINQGATGEGGVRFEDEALMLGAGVNAEGLHEAGMGVLASDFDNDGDADIFLSHLRDETNTYYRNLGPGLGFEDHTVAAGLAAASVAYTGFGTAAIDVDMDGDLDLAIVNGRVKRGPPLTDRLGPPWDDYAEPNLFFLNDGGTFRQLGAEAAAFTAPVEVSRGLAAGDLDGDGDLDLVATTTQGRAHIYRNQAPHAGHWLLVDAVDPRLGRRALGARVTVEAGGARQVRTIQGAMSYLSSSDPRAHFGLGAAATFDAVAVVWPDGTSESFPGSAADRLVRLVKGEGER